MQRVMQRSWFVWPVLSTFKIYYPCSKYCLNFNLDLVSVQGAEQVTHLCRLLHGHTGKMTNNEVAPPCKPLSDSQRIRKVIRELIETERHYVKVEQLAVY